jgi:DNA polymerase-3 subunit delta'
MSFSQFEAFNAYQPRVAQMLLNSFKKNRLSHAYIFEGPRGTKKLGAAFLFAKRLLCLHPGPDQNPCGVCANCTRIEKGVHPNVFLIRAEGEVIKVDQIRKMISELSRTSVENGPRIYVIDDAHKMNAESSNTLLKTLEEPGFDIYAVMVTDSFNALLKTIVSRSQVMHFQPIEKALVRADLIARGIDECVASVIPEYTNNIEDAVKIAGSDEMMGLLRAVPELYSMAGAPDKSMILRFREIRDAVFTTTDKTDFFLTLLILYQKDLLNAKLFHRFELVWRPETEKIVALAATVSQKMLEDNLEKMLALKTRLKYNIIDALAFDNLLMNLERGFNHAI